MKRTILSFVLVFGLLMVHFLAFAQDGIPTVPLGKSIDPKLINITGTWKYEMVSSGGPPAAGTCSITGGKGGYTLVLQSGAVCKPKSMCTITGQLTGNTLILSNTDTVDDEGGSVTNAMNLTVHSNELITGNGSSRYVHPEGFQRHWTETMTMTRKKGK